jgi:hypothetical protein
MINFTTSLVEMEYMYGALQKLSGRAWKISLRDPEAITFCGAELGSMGTKMNAAPGLYHALLTVGDPERCRELSAKSKEDKRALGMSQDDTCIYFIVDAI